MAVAALVPTQHQYTGIEGNRDSYPLEWVTENDVYYLKATHPDGNKVALAAMTPAPQAGVFFASCFDYAVWNDPHTKPDARNIAILLTVDPCTEDSYAAAAYAIEFFLSSIEVINAEGSIGWFAFPLGARPKAKEAFEREWDLPAFAITVAEYSESRLLADVNTPAEPKEPV